ncbi:HD domain-containing protein [Sorangium sp. So ce542]|uniref:HD domain-containing protein n=1 Tax=Sorangium sp. So ce542 TaxID=3133316 RepID=UPI003F631E12
MERPSEKRNWTETQLWRTLESLKSEDANAARRLLALERCMPDIQQVLDQGGTALPDFTLHDAGHAFRVAERMAEVIPPDVLPQLSGYELALLLLSAYLHDIGMTPERSKIVKHRAYLITGERGELTDQDLLAFQRMLDEHERGIEPPLTKGRPTSDELQLADEIVMYYCRERHNDWSREWIEEHLRDLVPPLYPDWTKDLATLCCSHHEGYQELRTERFEPMVRGVPSAPVQLRYLACVLRVADILEFDPERTPEVIVQHRDIAPSSRIYWAKDQAISFKIIRNEKESVAHIAITARPKDAYLHRAIEQTVEGVNAELETCRRLAEEKPFKVCPHYPKDLPHRWDLPVSITPDIRPHPGTYEYINGAFRPNVSKVLSLLSGVELYKDSIVAAREILQNAFDAVREKIARERIESPGFLDESDVLLLRKRHEVALKIESQGGEHWLVCKDNGAGMTKSIICDHLLVSGVTRRHDLVELERKCKAAGFSMERTGQFGIGVLSYFMLADRVAIETCRDGNISNSLEGAWRFETDGIGRFGELKPIPRLPRPGTEVRLRLRKSVVGERVDEWANRLEEYVVKTLVALPCRFSFTRLDGSSWNLSPGWTATDDSLASFVFKDLERRKAELVHLYGVPRELWSGSTSAHVEGSRQEIDNLIKDAHANLRWLRKEIALPHGLGRARVNMPYFELPGGRSLAFMRAKVDERSLRLEKILEDNYVFAPPLMEVIAAWNGMKANLHFPRSRNDPQVIAEIDLTERSVARVDVGRFELKVEGYAWSQLRAHLTQEGHDLVKDFLDDNRASAYATLNHSIADVPLLPDSKPHWIIGDSDAMRWEEFVFPVAEAIDFFWDRRRTQDTGQWNGRDVLFLGMAGVVGKNDRWLWHASTHAPDRIVLHNNADGVGLSGIWLHAHPVTKRSRLEGSWQDGLLLMSEFPPSWSHVLLVLFDSTNVRKQMVVNRANPIVGALDPSALRWIREVGEFPVLPMDEISSNRARAAAWLLDILRRPRSEGKEVWMGLEERCPNLVRDVWEMVVGGPDVPIYVWEQYRNQIVRIVRPGTWELTSDTKALVHGPDPKLHDPGQEWWLALPDATL